MPSQRVIDSVGQNDSFRFSEQASIRFIFTIREDFIPRMDDYSYNLPFLRRNRLPLKKLNGKQALDVIMLPKQGMIDKIPALKIIKNVTGSNVLPDTEEELASFNMERLSSISVDTSILSLYCSELFLKSVGEGKDKICFNDVQSDVSEEAESNDSVSKILMGFYVSRFKTIEEKYGLEYSEYLENELLTGDNFRNLVALVDIVAHFRDQRLSEDKADRVVVEEEEQAKINGITDYLEKERIISKELDRGTLRIEFTHDILCKIAKQHKLDVVLKAQQEQELKAKLEQAEKELIEKGQKALERKIKFSSLLTLECLYLIVGFYCIVSYSVSNLEWYGLLNLIPLFLCFMLRLPTLSYKRVEGSSDELWVVLSHMAFISLFLIQQHNPGVASVIVLIVLFILCLTLELLRNTGDNINTTKFWDKQYFEDCVKLIPFKDNIYNLIVGLAVAFICPVELFLNFQTNNQNRQFEIMARRGSILDTNGDTLAISRRVYNLNYVEKVDDEDTCNSLRFPSLNSIGKNNNWNPLFHFYTHFDRYYPHGLLARRLIGSNMAFRRSGIEYSYDGYLSGSPSDNGLDVRSSISINYQSLVDSVLRNNIDCIDDIRAGIVILMEVKTGAIRAMVDLARDTIPGSPLLERSNLALRQLCEPGSLMKPVTLTSLVEDGFVKLDQTIETNGGRIPGVPGIPKDNRIMGYSNISVIQGLIISSNYVFARLK